MRQAAVAGEPPPAVGVARPISRPSSSRSRPEGTPGVHRRRERVGIVDPIRPFAQQRPEGIERPAPQVVVELGEQQHVGPHGPYHLARRKRGVGVAAEVVQEKPGPPRVRSTS